MWWNRIGDIYACLNLDCRDYRKADSNSWRSPSGFPEGLLLLWAVSRCCPYACSPIAVHGVYSSVCQILNIKCFHFSNHSGRTFLSRFYPHFTTNSLNVIHFPFCHKRQRAIFLNARLFARGYRFLCLPFLPWLCFLQSDRPNSYHGREEQSLLIWMEALIFFSRFQIYESYIRWQYSTHSLEWITKSTLRRIV